MISATYNYVVDKTPKGAACLEYPFSSNHFEPQQQGVWLIWRCALYSLGASIHVSLSHASLYALEHGLLDLEVDKGVGIDDFA